MGLLMSNNNNRPYNQGMTTRPMVDGEKYKNCPALEVKDQKTVTCDLHSCKTVIENQLAAGFILYDSIQLGGNEIILIFRKQ
jgi:hypothetical protein